MSGAGRRQGHRGPQRQVLDDLRTIFAGEQVAASTATTKGAYDYAAHKGQMDTTVKTAGIPFRFTQRTLVTGSAVYTKMPAPPEVPDGGPPIRDIRK